MAHLYLHYVLDLWVKAWRKKVAKGEVIAVRYADDAVLGFQYREEAVRFLADRGSGCDSTDWSTPGEDALDRIRALCR